VKIAKIVRLIKKYKSAYIYVNIFSQEIKPALLLSANPGSTKTRSTFKDLEILQPPEIQWI
jgi:hypothetical protein